MRRSNRASRLDFITNPKGARQFEISWLFVAVLARQSLYRGSAAWNRSSPVPMLDRRFIVGVYALVGAVGAAAAFALDHDPVRTHAIWFAELPSLGRDGVSLALGLGLGGLGIASARMFVPRFAWARS